MKQIFDPALNCSLKNQKRHEVILPLLSFIIIPLISILTTFAGSDRPIFTSYSRIAWVDGYYPLILFVGGINMFTFLYGLILTLTIGGFTKKWKKLLISISSFAILLLTVGLSIPAYYDPNDEYLTMLRSMHTGFATPGFFGYLFVLIIFTIAIFFRNTAQGWLNVFALCFMCMAAAYAIFEVNDERSYCVTSSISQIFVFALYNINITINYFLMKYMPANKLQKA